MLIPEIHEMVAALSATIASYETNSVIAVLAITVVAWILLFIFLLSGEKSKKRWKSAATGRRAVFQWSWFWTAGAICSLVGWWGFFAWRLSSGLILVPTAPTEPIGVVFGYGLLLAAAMFFVGWVPKALLRGSDNADDTPAVEEIVSAEEDSLQQPLYPGLSFDSAHQPTPRTSLASPLQVAPAEAETPAKAETPAEPEPQAPRRSRLVFAMGVAVLAVGIFGVVTYLITPSKLATNERFAFEDLAGTFAGIFSRDGDVIRDDALDFQTNGKDIRDGDFAADVDRWRPLAEQGNAVAQYKLGVMHANGRGAPRDFITAYKWLNIAGAQGNENAIKGRDAVARRMTPAEVEMGQKRAREELSLGGGEIFTGEVPARLKQMTARNLNLEGQRLLNARGYNVGFADGIEGPRTRAAVREFERQGGLPLTGKITPELVTRLANGNRESRRPAVNRRLAAVSPPLSRPSVSAPAKRRAAPINDCDRLAAHPSTGIVSGEVTGIIFARIDAAHAIPACERAVAQHPGELRFQYQLARSLHKAERLEEAIKFYGKAGAKGFALAQRSFGYMYANGNGVAQDPVKAAKWLHQAAERCDVDAQFTLGMFYAKGQGVEKSDAESLRWYRIAAAQDHADARDRLNGFANLNQYASPDGDHASARAGDVSLNNRHKFEPGDYTAAGHIDSLLAKQKRDVVKAFNGKNFKTVLKSLRPLAEDGASPAQTLLGYMYREGLGVEQNDFEAVDWYRKAAGQDDPDAQYLLGYMHQRGFGVPQYFAQALQLFRKSAGQGVAAARVNLGTMYEYAQGVGRDRGEALAQYFSAAEAGLAGAQHSLAVAYENGHGVPRDLEEALKWYRLAAAQNFSLSQNRLGEMYSRGRGVARDLGEAVKWYRLAADEGLPDGQFNLARSFATGRGVARDPAEAMKLYTLAAENGHAEAQVYVALALRKGKGATRSYSDAVTWFQRAAAQCNADAQYQLASMYRLGQGVAKASAAEELKWLKLAAEQDHAEALQALSVRYADGRGVKKDPAKALKSMRRAAARGHSSAQFNLAEVYAQGSDAVPQDYAKAAEWYRKAAQQGNRTAQYELAQLYREGRGVARSYVEAVMWFSQAAERGDLLAQHSLATAYRLGAGVERDYGEAVRWYRQAAEQGETGSRRDLGLHYLRGEGVLQDYIQARLWLGLAAAKGDTQAAKAHSRLEKKMTPNQIAETERLEQKYLPDEG